MKTVIEPAFEIAPECGTVEEIRRRLAREGYTDAGAHLSGKLIRTQLYERLHPDLKKPHGRHARRVRLNAAMFASPDFGK
jgi:hypothetical protein